MHQAELLRANIENLIALWTACGKTEFVLGSGSVLHCSVNWPRRMWFDYDYHPDRQDLEQLQNRAAIAHESVLIPEWHERDVLMEEVLEGAGFAVAMTQETMLLSLCGTAGQHNGLSHLCRVIGTESTGQWTQVVSDSFGCYVHEPIVAALIGAPGFHLLVAEVDEAVVGTGLLLETGRIAGLHMVAVPPEHRRKGYARQIMFGLITLARELGCEHATLQASAAGEPLYRWLGFKAQGPIRSFRKSQP